MDTLTLTALHDEHLEQLAHWVTHIGDVVVDTVGVAEKRRIRVQQHGTLCERGHWTGQESWDTRANLDVSG